MESLLRLLAYHVLQTEGRKHLRNAPQMAVFAFDDIGHLINLQGQYERHELEVFFRWAADQGIDFSNSVALDIGANIGNHALCFASKFREVHAYEPNPRTYKLLALNAELADNIRTYAFGLSDADGTALLRVNPGNVGASRIMQSAGSVGQEIKLRSLDSAAKELHDIKLIKIDVEGHELKALRGARHLISEHNPIILFEQLEQDFVGEESPVVSLLQEYGYTQFAVLSSPVLRSRIGNRYLRALYGWTRSRLPGATMSLAVTDHIRRGNHPFIVAIPNALAIAPGRPARISSSGLAPARTP